MIAVLLFAFGAAGFLGNLLSALFIDRYLSAFILIALIAMALALVTLGIYGPLLGIAPVVVLLVIWGGGDFCFVYRPADLGLEDCR